MSQRGLSHVEVKNFYDAYGARQDGAGYYEDRTLADLTHHANFGSAKEIAEFGCGTGRFAEQLLATELSNDAMYWGCDISTTMIDLSRQRLAHFEERVTLWQSTDDLHLPLQDGSVDYFVSNYVLDILSYEEINVVLGEAKRILKQGGALYLTGLTDGKGLFSKAWTTFWNVRFALNPKWVGGCRPVNLLQFLDEWDIVHHNVIVARGISSEVVIAKNL